MSRVRNLAENLKVNASQLRSEAETQRGVVKDAYNSLCDVLDKLKVKLDAESGSFSDTWNPKI